jgi:hypothetical protein
VAGVVAAALELADIVSLVERRGVNLTPVAPAAATDAAAAASAETEGKPAWPRTLELLWPRDVSAEAARAVAGSAFICAMLERGCFYPKVCDFISLDILVSGLTMESPLSPRWPTRSSAPSAARRERCCRR